MTYKVTTTGPDWIDVYDTADFTDFDKCIAAHVGIARGKGADTIRIYETVNGVQELQYFEDLSAC